MQIFNMASDNTKIKQLFDFCISGDRIGLADYIITNKCNPSAYDAQDSNGQTALHIACQYGHLFVVRSLIEIFDCSPQVRDGSGNLPVHYACQYGHLSIVDYLMHLKGVNITRAVFNTDSEDSNLLHKACQSGSAPVVRYLQEIFCYNSKTGVPRKLNLYLDSTAPYDMSSSEKKSTHETRVLVYALLAKNRRGDTPLHVACRHGHLAIIKVFRSVLPFMKQLNLALTATRCNHIDLAEYIHSVTECKHFVDSKAIFGMKKYDAFEPYSGPLVWCPTIFNKMTHTFICPDCNKLYYCGGLSQFVCENCQVNLNLSATDSETIKSILQTTEEASKDYDTTFSPPYSGYLQATALSGNMQAFNKIKLIPFYVQSAVLVPETVAKDVPSRLQAAAYTEKMLKDNCFFPFDSGTLHSACISNNVKLVQHIMEIQNYEPNMLDPHGNTFLHVACEWGSYNVFKHLISLKDLKKDVFNKSNETPLLIACKYGRYDFCEHLMESISIIPNQETPLHLVTASSHVTVEVLTKFVNSSVVNSVDQYGDTPIFNACRCGNLVVVQFLIEKGLDPLFVNLLTKETPVHIACRMARHDILEALLTKSAAIIFEEKSITTIPIQLAIESGCEKTLLMLLKFCDPEVLNSALNQSQQNLAHFVCIANKMCILEYLLEHNINWNVQDINGATPLHLACYNNYTEIVKRIAPCCKVTTQNKDMLWTPIHIASLYGHVKILDILFVIETDSENLNDLVDKDGNNPLHLACKAISYSSYEIVERLFKHCSLTAQNKVKSRTPLHIACESGHLALINLLLKRLNSDANLLIDSNKNTILYVAVENTSSLEVVRAVVDVVQPVHKNSHGETPIHIACKNGDLDIVCLLVTKAAKPILTDNGDSYLHSACCGVSLKVVKYLTEKSELDFAKLMCQNSDKNTPLHCVCISGDHDIVCYLMEHASEYAQILNKDGLTPFCCLLSSGHHNIIKYILLNEVFDKTKLVEEENPLLHCVIKYIKDPKLVFGFVKFIIIKGIYNPLKCDSKNNTIVHSFLLQIPTWVSENKFVSVYEIWEFILDIPGIQLCTQNEDDDTPLHILVEVISNYSSFIGYANELIKMYLDRAVPIDSTIVNYKNKNGKTAIQLASRDITPVLIKYGANPEDVFELYGSILVESKKNLPLNPSTKIVVLGNSKAGKSTLIEAIKSIDLPTADQNQLVESIGSTAGINMIDHKSKVLGCITFHDFGGQPEFESANAVFLKTKVSIDYPPLFLVVVDISQTDLIFVKQIQYWFSYIKENTPVQLTPHIIIIGSHSDCIPESDYQRVKKCIDRSMKSDKSCKLANMIFLDCRKVASKAIQELCQCIADSSKQLQCSLELDGRCHVLIAYLSEWFRNDSELLFKKIQDRISNYSHLSQNVLPVVTEPLLNLVKSLHSAGHITLLNPEDIDHCWIVLNGSLLYEKINGILFAPIDQDFSSVPKLPTNIGVITSNMLKPYFKDCDIDLITAYIVYSEFGQMIDDTETLQLIQSACQDTLTTTSQMEIEKSPLLSGQEDETIVSVTSSGTDKSTDKYLFLPNLVKNERPKDVWSDIKASSYPFCWYMKCEDKFLSQRFLQVLLLRLTFNFVSVTGSSMQLRGKCNIWKNGIHWSTNQGVEVLVEVIEQNSAVVLLTRFTDGLEIEGVKFRSELIKKILDTKTEFCQNTEVNEYLFPQTTTYPINNQLAANVSVVEIAQAITKGNPCVIDSNAISHKISNLLFFEPFVVNLEWLWCDEDQERKISSENLAKVYQALTVNKEMVKRAEDLMENIKSSTIITNEKLRKLIGSYSIFNYQNPFVSMNYVCVLLK